MYVFAFGVLPSNFGQHRGKSFEQESSPCSFIPNLFFWALASTIFIMYTSVKKSLKRKIQVNKRLQPPQDAKPAVLPGCFLSFRVWFGVGPRQLSRDELLVGGTSEATVGDPTSKRDAALVPPYSKHHRRMGCGVWVRCGVKSWWEPAFEPRGLEHSPRWTFSSLVRLATPCSRRGVREGKVAKPWICKRTFGNSLCRLCKSACNIFSSSWSKRNPIVNKHLLHTQSHAFRGNSEVLNYCWIKQG
jgi:hypothetical protein